MGGMEVCARVLLVIVNIFFLTLGLVLFAFGLFIRFGSSVYDSYIDGVKKSLESSASSSGFGNIDFSNFDLNEILLPLALGLIFFGLVLIIITVLGCCGSCYKIKFMLIGYVIICLVLLVAQLIVIGILYGSPDTTRFHLDAELASAMFQKFLDKRQEAAVYIFHDPAKKRLKDGIQNDYQGLNGTNLVSLGWNIVVQQVKCCGVDDYNDFTGAPGWVIDYTSWSPPVTLKTPLACCKTLPSSTDLRCADTTGATDSNNYQSTGCYDKIWEDTLGNSTIMIAALVSIGIFQVILILFGIFLLLSNRKNKTGVDGDSPSKKNKKGRGSHRSPVVTPSSVTRPGLKF